MGLTPSIGPFMGDYFFLSNFYQRNVYYNGYVFKTAEHAYQASKCVDMVERQQILFADTAGKAKRLGQKCKVHPNWNEIKVETMYSILIAKFADVELRELLLNTEDAELIEINAWDDTFWGICKGKGENWLGRNLMKVREHYKSFNNYTSGNPMNSGFFYSPYISLKP